MPRAMSFCASSEVRRLWALGDPTTGLRIGTSFHLSYARKRLFSFLAFSLPSRFTRQFGTTWNKQQPCIAVGWIMDVAT
eukprot:3418665-Rhodomonas_salina.2